jgi:hypothetical protein
MFLINENTKQLILSHGKNGTTSVADTLKNKDPNWQEVNLGNTIVKPYGKYRNYTAYILFRDPLDRYISGLLEDIQMLMLPDQEGLKYNRQIISLNKNAQMISYKQISDDRTAVLLVEKDVKYFDHLIRQVYKMSDTDYSLGESYHVANWLWEAFAMHSIADTTIWIDMPNLDTFFKQHFDLDLPRHNVKSSKDKNTLKKALTNIDHYWEGVQDYLSSETSLYNIIMENRNENFTLKDFTEIPNLAHKITFSVYDNYSRQKTLLKEEQMVRTFISLIYQKHWNRK